MKTYSLLSAVLLLFLSACQNPESVDVKPDMDLPDSLSSRRISFVLDLKASVAEKTWADFGTRTNEGTLIYFESDRSEIFFPDSNVLEKLSGFKKHSDDYVLSGRTDSIPYHIWK